MRFVRSALSLLLLSTSAVALATAVTPPTAAQAACPQPNWRMVAGSQQKVFRGRGEIQSRSAPDGVSGKSIFKFTFTQTETLEMSVSGGVELGFAVAKFKVDGGLKNTTSLSFTGEKTDEFSWSGVVGGRTFNVQYGGFSQRAIYERDRTNCGLDVFPWMPTRYTVEVPESVGFNIWYDGYPVRAEGGGGGGVTPPSPGPQPVESVYGLADGTVLHTTDTRRIYKMVGGAPVWQATCDGGICQPQSRPTRQSVIDAGPATPRNGSSAVDQRGRVYLFVGGAPLWQSHCDAPVNCGTPPRISDWSIDAREHMNLVPADGQLLQGWDGGVGTPVAATVGGARINFANEAEVVDTGHGADWSSRVVAVSTYAFQGLGEQPADGTLVQGAGVGGDTPVAMFVAGARINFANPQEVIDAGYGTDWRSKVRAIPTRAFTLMHANIPPDGSLVQGTNGSTPVAMMVGGSRVDFANPQEVIDAGYGTNWPSKVRGIPVRAFNMIPADLPADGTLIQGTGGGASTAVAEMVGGGRVDFHSPEEVVAAGHGTDWGTKVRAIPTRAFHLITTRIADRTVLRAPDATAGSGISPQSVFLVVGGARVGIATEQELFALGYQWSDVDLVPVRTLRALPTRIANSTVFRAPDATPDSGISPQSVFVAVGGGRIGFHTEQEFLGLGYRWEHVVPLPARVARTMLARVGDGGVFRAPDATPESGVDPSSVFLGAGGARIGFHTEQELFALGYQWSDVTLLPVRVVKAMPTTLRDGTLIQGWADGTGTGTADVYGGKRFVFGNPNEVVASGFGTSWSAQVVRVPVRVFDQLPTAPGAPTLAVRAPGRLTAGQSLAAGQSVATANGQYRLVMQADGNLVQFTGDADPRALWSSNTAGHPGATAVLQRDGNLVVRGADGAALWNSGTGGRPDGDHVLAVQSDANLVVYAAGGAALWSTGRTNGLLPAGSTLRPGWSLRAPGGRGLLLMHEDGTLVLYAPDGRALWSSETGGHPGASAVLQRDGNLVVRGADGAALWSSGTGGNADAAYTLTVRDDGTAAVSPPTGSALWVDNRVDRVLAAGRTLLVGWTVRSADRRYSLTMQSDGNLVEYGPDGADVWSTRTTVPGSRVTLQRDGNLVLTTSTGHPVWNSGTGGRPDAAYLLAVQNDGNVVVYAPDGSVVWSR
ncbi:hypothetical protein [Longispora urticae]